MKEEITKEIKNLDEIETPPVEEEKEQEIIPQTDPPIEEEKKDEKSKKKKKVLIIGGIVVGIIIIILLIVLLLPKDKKESSTKKTSQENGSKFVTAIKNSIESGEFDKEINEGLQESGVTADSVCILRMDLDSDGDKDLVAYAEGNNKKTLIQFDVDDRVSYEDYYLLDSKDSLGYVYSSETEENHWYTEHEKNFTIISSAKKIIKEEDFLSNYFSLTKTYQQKPILNHCIEYKFDNELDVETLEENTITEKDLLEDNNIKSDEIKEAYKKYLTEKTEKEKKEKEEAEKKAKEEAEQKKVTGTFTLGNNTYNYGLYKIYNAENEEVGEVSIYSDGTCICNGVACTYQIREVRNAEDELVPGIELSNNLAFISSAEKELLEPTESLTARYAS